MGPTKGSRTIPKITIRGYEDPQHHEEPTSSIKVKLKKRKMSDLGPQWSRDELMLFYEAYRQHGKNWKKISAAVGGKSADTVEALYSAHRTFLSLPERDGTSMGFIALVTGHHNVLDESPIHKESEQTVRASGKARKHGETAQQKENKAPQLHHEMVISGFSSSFKKRYLGGLFRFISRNPCGPRTPRVPVIVPSYINATDNSTPEIKNVANSIQKVNKEINNDGAIISSNGCSPDGSSGITDANKVFQSHTQQHLKKRRTEQSLDEGQINKVDHETMIIAEEGNNLANYETLSQLFSPDEMLVLDVLESLVTVPKNNAPSDILGNNVSASSHRREEEVSPVDLSKQSKHAGEFSASKTRKKRRKTLLDEEVPAQDQSNSGNTLCVPACQLDTTERPSLHSESQRGAIDLPESTANISAEVSPFIPIKTNPEMIMPRKSKRKYKTLSRKKYVSCNEGADSLQARKLLHCLSSESLRRWCAYEWFYSAVDYPWYMNNEFVNYLNFAKLSHLSRLTRSEWSTIRSSLGKPRRFSDHFLAVEREKLEDYRENVRKYYAKLSDGLQHSLPADLARPFSLGQQVIARHPSTQELSDGKVVMIKWDSYTVQFDRPDLGSDIVKDTDCMPVSWSDNLPDDLNKISISYNAHSKLDTEQILELTPEDSWDHDMDGLSMPDLSRNRHIKSDAQLKVDFAVDRERLINKSSIGRYADNSSDHNDGLDSYIVTQFVQNSILQAKNMVTKVMQAFSENDNDSQEGTSTSNQATNCTSLESEDDCTFHDAQFPSNLILNCVATIIAIKDLSEYRHPPAKIAGVLEQAFSMLRPSCSENLAIYNEIESCISTIKNQILALVPTTSGNGSSSMLI